MKKPINVLSKTALATVFATSALIPTAVVQAEEVVEHEIVNVVFEKDGKHLTLPIDEYLTEFLMGNIHETEVPKYAQFGSDKSFDIDEYLVSYLMNNSEDEATYKDLEENSKSLSEKVEKGELKDGFVVPVEVEQPEDRLNETFFYNVA